MWIFRSAADGSDRRLDCRRAQLITSPRAARNICATNCKKLRAANANSERVTELEQILATVHVVDPPDPATNSIGADRDQRSQITDQNHWLSVIWV